MITSPWKSTVLRQHKTKDIISELALAKAMGGLMPESDSVILVTPNADKVDAFVLPITSEEYGNRNLSTTKAVFVDARSFLKKDQRSDTGFLVANQTQADFVVRLGELTAMWVKNPDVRDDFLRVGDLAPQVYISWLSSLISGKLGVDMETAREVQIITGLFYIHQFYDADVALQPRSKDTYIRLVQRWTRAPIQLIMDIVDKTQYMGLIEDYVNVLHDYFAANTRIAMVNSGFIVMSLGRSWFGFGATELAGCAIEYPPVFLALVEAAANAKVWRKTGLGTLVQRLGMAGTTMNEFIRSMETLAGKLHPMVVSNESYDANSPATDSEISLAQKELGVTFAKDYIAFLKQYGVLTVGSHEIYGLGTKAGHLDVVKETKSISKYFKTKGLYVIESVGVDSVFICADSKGSLYQVSPTKEEPMNKTFSQYLDAIIAGND